MSISETSEAAVRVNVRLLGAVEVVDAAPFNGPITVKTGQTSHVLGRDLARHIRVEANRIGTV